VSQALLFGDNTNSLIDQISYGQAHGTVPSVGPWPIGITESATFSSGAEPSIDMDLFSGPIDPLGAMIEIPNDFDWVSYIFRLQLQRDLSLYTECTIFKKKMLRIFRKLLIARLCLNKPLRKPGQTSCKTSRLKMMVIIYNLSWRTNTTAFSSALKASQPHKKSLISRLQYSTNFFAAPVPPSASLFIPLMISSGKSAARPQAMRCPPFCSALTAGEKPAYNSE
jgi:hypothetical protein